MKHGKKLSFSSWNMYNTCPFKWKCKNVLGLDEGPSGPAAARGTLIHGMMDNYITGKSDVLPWDKENGAPKVPALGDEHPLDGVVKRLREIVAVPEMRVEFTREWEPWPPPGKPAEAVVVFDAIKTYTTHTEVAEWKSGKPSDSHADQRLIYALGALHIYNPPEVRVTTYYIDMTGPAQRNIITRAQKPKLQKLWDDRRAAMEADDIMAPRANPGCRYCAFRKSVGGPCAFA
jgi:CRISPR/Cas system-associated exonuclease Cas4 (RecB family)